MIFYFRRISQNIENKIKYYIEDLKENINRINYKYYSQVDIDLLFEDEILNYKLILRKRKIQNLIWNKRLNNY